MPSDINTFFAEWKTGTERMKLQAPDIARGYGSFYHTLMKEGALASREKELIALKFGARLTNRSIAQMMGLTAGNVGVILFRALRKLQAELVSEGWNNA